jgi:hypothetical protein
MNMDTDTIEKLGYVYILSSPNCDCIKIGGTDYPPLKRIKEINNSEPYKSIGPWSLCDFRQVNDWRKVEYNLHYEFRSKLNIDIEQQKELFHITIFEASKSLNELDPELIIGKPKVDRLFQDESFLEYLVDLFRFTGILHWLEIQGMWTFVLFPSTAGGRYFTLNIGPHEVAFSTLPKKDEPQQNMILVDKLIFDFGEVINWIKYHNGSIEVDHYERALPRSVSIQFEGSFSESSEFYKLDGVRRALIAYWNEALINLKEKETMSVYARHHNWNAIARIKKIIDDGKYVSPSPSLARAIEVK